MQQSTIKYIIQFLAGDNISTEILDKIGYTSNADEFPKYKLVIKPSGFFDEDIYGTEKSLPVLPLKIWEESPILFGEAESEMIGETLILSADLVASAFFMLTRYEEFVRKEVRDVHGRFPGKESLAYRAGFIDHPIIDEYSVHFRKLLQNSGFDVPEYQNRIKKIYLTHDVDSVSHFRNVKSLAGALLRGIKRRKEASKALKSFFGGLRYDPWYTFPFLYKINNELIQTIGSDRCETLLFIRSSNSRRKEDKPVPNLTHPDYQHLIKYSKRKGVRIGLHASYAAGIKPDLIADEKRKLEVHAKINVCCNRHHYLNTREPFDMIALLHAGITHDFSMGYADMAGFRLGTCRPVQWINLLTGEVTELTLHSLQIMDVSLNDKRYMYMSSHDALQYCTQLIDTVEKYSGELVLLWHNTSVEKTPNSYHRSLYKDIVKYLHTK